MSSPSMRRPTRSSGTSWCIRVRAAWLFCPDGSRAFIPSESVGELNVVDTANQKLLKTITLPKGSRPMTVKVAPDGKKIYVSTGRGGTVCVLDATTYEVLNNIAVGKRPWASPLPPMENFSSQPTGRSDDVSVVDLTTEKESHPREITRQSVGIVAGCEG